MLVLRKETATFELWKFAARYSLIELEVYCRSNQLVVHEIKQNLCDSAKGLSHLLNDGTPILVLEGVIRKIMQHPVTAGRYSSYEFVRQLEQVEELRTVSVRYEVEAAELEARLFSE